MIKFKDFIVEGLSPILYHLTTADKMLSILREDRFRLANSLGTKSDRMYKKDKFKPYYLSCSRQKFGGYSMSFSERREQVIIVLDGVALGHNYEGMPVDYWGPEWKTMTMDTSSRLRNNENEDRVFSDKPTIEKAHKYIKEIHILIDKNAGLLYRNYSEYEALSDGDRSFAFNRNQMYGKIAQYCAIMHIPVYFYLDFHSFKVQDKRKAIEDVKGSVRIEDIVELFTANSQSELSPSADKARYNVLYSRYDFERSLDSDIHNRKTDEIEQLSIAKLVRWMKKYKLRTTVEVAEFLAQKWKGIGVSK